MPDDSNLTKSQRRDAARAEALKLRQEQERREKRNRFITIGVLVLLVIAVVLAVVFINQANKPKSLGDVKAPSTAQSVSDGGGIPVDKDGVAGKSNAGAVDVDLYYDYMCPNCGTFEKVNKDDLDALREDGTITFVMHPVAILNRLSQGTNYSTRSASAFATVADQEPGKVIQFHEALYANHPEENSTGLTDDQLKDYAVQAGVSQKVADQFSKHTFADWVDAWTDRAGSDKALFNSQGGFGTPTIVIDGKRWDGNWSQAGALKSAIEDAKSGSTN
jgi:protein-disulfide isomerase